MSAANGDGPNPRYAEQVLPVHLYGLWELLQGGEVRQGFIESLPAPLHQVGRAMAAANGGGRYAAMMQYGAEWAPAIAAEAPVEVSTTQPAASYPVEALPPVLWRLVEEGAAATSTPPELVALPLLTTCAGAIGNTAILRYSESWKETASVWFAVVAEAGSGKTPAQNIASEPIERLVTIAETHYRDERQEYERDLEAWQRLKPHDRHGPAPAEPVRTRYLAKDATLEALKRVLAANPGVAMLHDELTSWVKGFDAYRGGRGGDRANWLSLWAGSSISVDRASQEYIYIERPVVALCGGIQPMRLSVLADEASESDGFLERFLWGYPYTEPVHLSRARVRPETTDAVTRMLRDLRHRVTAGTALVVPSEQARRAFEAWHAVNVERMRQASGIIRSVYAKLPGQLLKLALILHCVNYPTDPAARAVSPDEIDDAILLVEYHRRHAHRALGAIGAASKATKDVERQPAPDSAELLAERIMRVLERHGDGGWLTTKQINEHLSILSNSATRSAARDLLMKQGRIERQIRTGTVGRPAELWRLRSRAGGLDRMPED